MEKNSPHNEPTPEERARIVKAVETTMMRRDEKETAFGVEMQQLANLRNEAREHVRMFLQPVVEAAKMRSPIDPLYIHSETGRMVLYEQAARLYLDSLRKLSKEDAITLLAFVYAELTLNEFV